MSSSSQKFIGRNRAPRVHIEYEVETYGSAKKVELPFIMGVMADLYGSPEEAPPDIADRKFLDIDANNFDDRLRALKPRVAFNVKNTLSEEGGSLPVAITFERLDDFSPAAIARKVEPLRELLRAREQLSNLLTWSDGKADADKLLVRMLSNLDDFKQLVTTLEASEPKTDKPEG